MSIPTLEEQFLPRLVSVFYAVFHPTEGPKVIYQVPEGSITQEEQPHASGSKDAGKGANANAGMLGGEPLFNFSALSEYLIPKAPLCGRLVTSIARGAVRRYRQPVKTQAPETQSSPPDASVSPAQEELPLLKTYKILGFPTIIEDAERYQRNNFIFNLCFVFDGHADVRAYEPVVRKCGRMLRSLEESQSFLSSPRSLPRMYAIIEQLFEDLNSYCESFVALPEAPHTSYLHTGSKPNSPELQKLLSPVLRPDDFVSLGGSFATLRDEHHKKLINEHLRLTQISNRSASPRTVTSSSSESDSADIGATPSSLLSSRADLSMTRSNSSTGTTGPASDNAHTNKGLVTSTSPRPGLTRSSTMTAETYKVTSPISEGRDSAMGSARDLHELKLGTSATEAPGNVIGGSRDQGAFNVRKNSHGTPKSSRASSRGQSDYIGNTSLEQLTESIVSIRTIDAALSNSVNALRTETIDATNRASFVEKREPPHGLGRTVRDAINLKLFPVYSNPPAVNDWDVPVALLDLSSRVDGNWDLTMRRVLPFIDGVTHVKRIAQLADADLGLTRACLEHLIYYGCIIVVDVFQYFNMYTVRPAIAKMADDEAMGRECAAYVTRSGCPMPSYPELLRLYSLLRAGKTIHDWIEDNDVDAKGIDVRRFVSFGVIQGFLRRVHRYALYLDGGTSEDAESTKQGSSMPSTVRNSPNSNPRTEYSGRLLRQQTSSTTQRRDDSGSREPRDRRPRELSGMSGAYSAFQRVARDGSIDSPGVRAKTIRRAASDIKLGASAAPTGPSAAAGSSHITETHQSHAGTSGFGTSPTKKLQRQRQRQAFRHPTATANDVASVAFGFGDNENSGQTHLPGGARSPRKRASAIAPGSHAASSGYANVTGGASASAISHRSVVYIPAGLIEMLDGTHHDDELCVTFSLSWPELEKILVHIGTAEDGQGARLGLGFQPESEEDDPAFSHNRSDWRRWQSNTGTAMSAAGAGTSSAWNKAKLSGFSGIGSTAQGRSALSGAPSSGHASSNRAGMLAGDSSINMAGASGFGIGVAWGVEADESGVAPGWSGFSAPDRQAIEAGDLGRVRILLQ